MGECLCCKHQPDSSCHPKAAHRWLEFRLIPSELDKSLYKNEMSWMEYHWTVTASYQMKSPFKYSGSRRCCSCLNTTETSFSKNRGHHIVMPMCRIELYWNVTRGILINFCAKKNSKVVRCTRHCVTVHTGGLHAARWCEKAIMTMWAYNTRLCSGHNCFAPHGNMNRKAAWSRLVQL